MARRTASEIYQAARVAGMNVAQAVTATAVALAESGGNDTAVGDVGLQTGTWGPSVGVWQVRTLKADTGKGTDRDVTRLQGNLVEQAKAAWDISDHGTDWTPWTAYNTGAYSKFAIQARAAAGVANSGGGANSDPGSAFEQTGLGDVPGAGLVRDAVVGVLADSVAPARKIVLTVVFVGLGMTLVGVGMWRLVAPAKKAAEKAVAGVVL